MKKSVLTSYLIILLITTAISSEKYKQVRVPVPDRLTIEKIISLGIDLEGADGKIGDKLVFTVSDNDLALLTSSGFFVEILIDDLEKYYSERLHPASYNALGFGYGSMGGYYTYTEIVQQLDSMKLLYPSLITVKQIIGATIQGRSIYSVKISDNPDINEINEPSVLYTALTHSREPQSMMTVLYYMWWLLENYGTNAEATYLINNRQMWFIPVISADGYVYNQTTNPNGGGMWRKNRRLNSDNSYGVDLNRNYGPYDYWNAPNGGSSTTPSSDTYRGTAPFSEPEDQAIRDFLVGKKIKACFNYHTYSNLLVYPYGALSRETPDSLIYRELAKDLTAFNNYVYGTDMQTVGYSTRGNSDDFMYDGDIANNGKIFAMTPEVGSASDGFWPPSSRIFPLAQENLFPNKYLSNAVGSYPVIAQRSIIDSSSDGYLERGEKFTIRITLRNKGLDTAKNISIQLLSSNPAIQVPSNLVNINALSPFTSKIDTFQCAVAPFAQTGINVQVFTTITDQSGRVTIDTIPLFIGKKLVRLVFSDSANNGIANWTTGTGWGLTTNNNTPPFAFTDSPTGQYTNSVDNSLTLLTSLKLAGATEVKLKFFTKWSIEKKWDFATVEASSNGGISWTTLRGKYTKPASGSGVQTLGTHGYDDKQLNWVEEEMDVTPYVSSNFKFRFRLRSDGSLTDDGIYVDDIRLILLLPDTTKYRDMLVNVTSVDFGTIDLATVKDTIITIQNLYTSNDTLQGFAQLSLSDNFLLPNGGDFKIGIGNNYLLNVAFSPDSFGVFYDTLFIYHNSTSSHSPLKVILRGIGEKLKYFITVNRGWNLLSLPLDVVDARKDIIYPSSTSPAFIYLENYIMRDSLRTKEGYWLKFNNSEQIGISGKQISNDTVSVRAGWNLIGAVSTPVSVSNIQVIPPTLSMSEFYCYNFAYQIIDILQPGYGYWVKVDQDGELILITSGNR